MTGRNTFASLKMLPLLTPGLLPGLRTPGLRTPGFVALIALIISLSLPLSVMPAAGAVGHSNHKEKNSELMNSAQGLPTSAFSNDMVDGASFVEKMLQSAESYQDYTFDYSMNVFNNRKTVEESGVFYFKKPRLIRLEETGDFKHGAVAVLGPNGKVQAHLGGGLKLFVVELPPTSNLLRSANGYPMVDSDFISLAQALKRFIKEGYKCEVTKEPVEMKGVADKVYVLEFRKAAANSPLWKRVAASAHNHLPVQWWDYDDDGQLHNHAIWDNFKPNQQLADHIFNMKGGDDIKDASKGRTDKSG